MRCLPGGASVSSTRRGHRAFEDRRLRRPAVLGVVVGPLEVVEVGADVHRAAVLRADLRAGQALEVRQFVEGDVDLDGGAGVVDGRHAGAKVVGQELRVHQLEKGDVAIGAGGDARSVELPAVLEGDAADLAVLDR